MLTRQCEACGTRFEQTRGRPRRWCATCSPSVAVAGRAGAAAAWRLLNTEQVEHCNKERRMTNEEWNSRGYRRIVDDETLAAITLDGSTP